MGPIGILERDSRRDRKQTMLRISTLEEKHAFRWKKLTKCQMNQLLVTLQ